ncbi:MAG: hypothetical protein AAGI52_07145 [Bacteroidota bacterium]
MLRLAVLFLLAASLAHAQPVFNLPSIPTSTAAASAARSATLSGTGDPHEMMLNPAFLGEASGLRVSGSGSSAWLGFDDIGLRGLAVSYGADLEVAGRPVRLGVGAVRDVFRIENIAIAAPDPTSLTFDLTETAHTLGAGVRLDGPVRTSLGIAATYRLGADLGGGEDYERDRGLTLDLGSLVEIPLSPGPIVEGTVGFPFSLVAGAAHRNVGLASGLPERDVLGEFPGGPESFQGSLPPSETVLGAGTRLAVDQAVAGGTFTLASLDSRVEREWVGSNEVQPAGLDGTRLALAVTLFETLALRSGFLLVDDRRQSDRSGSSLSFRIDGLLRGIGIVAEDDALRSVGERLTFHATVGSYDFTSGETSSFFGDTRYAGLTLGWRP